MASDADPNKFSYTGTSFQDYFQSVFSLFVLLCTGENYADLVYHPWFGADLSAGDISRMPSLPFGTALSVFFFIVLCILGSFFIIGMLIGVFQDSFSRARADQLTHQKLFERVGALAAFSLIDVDRTGYVSQLEFRGFIHYLEAHHEAHFRVSGDELFSVLQEDGGAASSELSISDFVYNFWCGRSSQPPAISASTPHDLPRHLPHTPDQARATRSRRISPYLAVSLRWLQLKGLLLARKDEEGAALATWRSALRRAYEHPSQGIQKSVRIVLIAHALLAATYGLMPKVADAAAFGTDKVDQLVSAILVLEALEVLVKLAALGRAGFWSCAEFDNARVFEQCVPLPDTPWPLLPLTLPLTTHP